jgi:hypothetical protein
MWRGKTEQWRYAAAPLSALHILNKSAFGEAHRISAADDDVIEHFDFHEIEDSLELLGDVEIGLARLGNTAGVIVSEDDGGGVVFEGFFEDLAWIDRCAVDGAAKEVFAGDELMALGQVNHAEDFVIESAESDSQVVGGDSWGGESGASADALGQCAAGCIEDFFEACLSDAGRGVAVVCV